MTGTFLYQMDFLSKHKTAVQKLSSVQLFYCPLLGELDEHDAGNHRS